MAFAFYAENLDQLDVACAHLALGTANDARFALMLSDNVIELTLHKTAQDKDRDLRSWSTRAKEYQHAEALQEAMGRRFDKKVKFAKIEGMLSDEVADSINIFHEHRNEAYHLGLRQEQILLQMSKFCFDTACNLLAAYKSRGLSWGSRSTLPDRIKPLFKSSTHRPSLEEFRAAPIALATKAPFDAEVFIKTLSDHLTQIVDTQNQSIEILSDTPRARSREEAVLDAQVWALIWNPEAGKLARQKGYRPKDMADWERWLAQNYPLQARGDPIPKWRQRVLQVRRETNPHKALKKYNDFLAQTEIVRANIDASHSSFDQYVEEQIEAARLR